MRWPRTTTFKRFAPVCRSLKLRRRPAKDSSRSCNFWSRASPSCAVRLAAGGRLITKIMDARVQILVRGIVQGVGFRPFIFSQAQRRALKGRVLNNTTGVLIDVEGELSAIGQLIDEIRSSAPPLSVIESVERRDHLALANYDDFRIVESDAAGAKFVPLSADIATCADCLDELFDPANRRHCYPFINCTNCGPRFTIIEDVPYD